MKTHSIGIILRKSTHSQHKISLLDKYHGRIEGIVQSPNLCVGGLISYAFDQQPYNYIIRDIELIYTPLQLGSIDLLFLHHVLELLYYFAPVGSCVNGIFDLLAFLYSIEDMLISEKFKKFFLLKVLTFLGVIPELDSIRFSSITALCNTRIDLFSDDMVDEEIEKKLHTWLCHCVWQHPYANEFKTVHFLDNNRVI